MHRGKVRDVDMIAATNECKFFHEPCPHDPDMWLAPTCITMHRGRARHIDNGDRGK